MKYVKSSGDVQSSGDVLGAKYVQRRRSGVFIVNFEHVSHLVLIFNFEHVIFDWAAFNLQQFFHIALS